MAALSVSEAAVKSSPNRNRWCCSSKAAASEYELCFLFVFVLHVAFAVVGTSY
jgi:hypothetical protein